MFLPYTMFFNGLFSFVRLLYSVWYATVGKIKLITQGQSFCEICLENRQNRNMYTNKSCRHSFCYECTSKYIETRMKENEISITCPSPNCGAALDYDIRCRRLISEEVLNRWDRFLCESSIPESERLFCPFHNCSALLITCPGEIIKKTECPECKRLFCAQCLVPWHENFNCREFKAMSGGGDRDELMFNSLVGKRNWQKCPNCKIHIEKVAGCSHIICRCKYQFCYNCGSRWSIEHVCAPGYSYRPGRYTS